MGFDALAKAAVEALANTPLAVVFLVIFLTYSKAVAKQVGDLMASHRSDVDSLIESKRRADDRVDGSLDLLRQSVERNTETVARLASSVERRAAVEDALRREISQGGN